MKPFQSLISATLAMIIVFTACNNDTSDKEAAANTDTSAATVSAVDGNQEKLDANKKLVTDFYQSLYGDKDSTAVDKYVESIFEQSEY